MGKRKRGQVTVVAGSKVKKCSSIAAVLADIVHRAILASMNERNPPKM